MIVASVDGLLQATGSQRGSLYQAFGSKRGLFLATSRAHLPAPGGPDAAAGEPTGGLDVPWFADATRRSE